LDEEEDWTHHILGLRQALALPVYPVDLRDQYLVFGIFNAKALTQFHVSVVNDEGSEFLGLNLDGGEKLIQELTFPAGLGSKWSNIWQIITVKIDRPLLIMGPQTLRVLLQSDGKNKQIGILSLTAANIPPLTPELIEWLKLNPDTAGWQQLNFTCNQCSQSLKVYAGISRNEGLKSDGWIWYQDLPDRFECECGSLGFDLKYIRSNMHALLGHAVKPDGNKSLIERYHNSALDVKRIEFQLLLDLFDDTTEERVQNFLKTNPVFLSLFSPIRIFFKAPILSKYKTDIVILNHKKELLLIELEKPQLRLIKKDGGMAAELQHPFDQVRDWMHEVEEHRAAVLSGLGLSLTDVGMIRGVVIAGRDKPYDSEHLRKLKKVDFGNTTLYTYDDLIMGLSSLARSFRSI
jgi:hypothetical protein